MTSRLLDGPPDVRLLLGELDPDASPDPGDLVTSPDEVARARRYRRSSDGRRFLLRRSWVRRALGGILGVHPRHLELEAGPFGKPRVRTPRGAPGFSVSHSGNRSLLAVAHHGEVGVDLEALGAAPDAEELAPLALSPAELAELRALDTPCEREFYFLARWTAKEALLKAIGAGLQLDPASIALTRRPGGFSAPEGTQLADLRVASLKVGAGLVAAVAFTPRPPR